MKKEMLIGFVLMVMFGSLSFAADVSSASSSRTGSGYAWVGVEMADCPSTATYALRIFDGATTETMDAVVPTNGAVALKKKGLSLAEKAYTLSVLEIEEGVSITPIYIGIFKTKEILRIIDSEFEASVISQLQIMPASHRPIFLDALRNVVAGWMRNKQVARIAKLEEDRLEY